METDWLKGEFVSVRQTDGKYRVAKVLGCVLALAGGIFEGGIRFMVSYADNGGLDLVAYPFLKPLCPPVPPAAPAEASE